MAKQTDMKEGKVSTPEDGQTNKRKESNANRWPDRQTDM